MAGVNRPKGVYQRLAENPSVPRQSNLKSGLADKAKVKIGSTHLLSPTETEGTWKQSSRPGPPNDPTSLAPLQMIAQPKTPPRRLAEERLNRHLDAPLKAARQEEPRPPSRTTDRAENHVGPEEEDKELNDSFAAEDNDNELNNCVWPNVSVAPSTFGPSGVGNHKGSAGGPFGQRKVSAKAEGKLQGHFELEMHKHGLLDEIVHIQQLNDYFEAELGTKKEGAEGRSPGESRNSPNTTIDKQAITEKGYTFPFQKRARSQSPPRNAVLFGSQNGEEQKPENSTARRPVVATVNFVLGKVALQRDIGPKPQFVEPSLKLLEPDDAADCCGLSTGPTDEGRANVKPHLADELDNEWLYQRIDGNNGTPHSLNEDSPPSASPSNDEGKAGGGTFLQLLSSVKFES